MSATGDGRASWITDKETATTEVDKPIHKEAYGKTLTGDPRAAYLGGHAGEVEEIQAKPKEPKEPKEDVHETLSGDPRRAAFAAGYDTTAPHRGAPPPDTGIHAVGTGDPRAAWVSNSAVDPIDAQEERDIRRAIAESLKDQGSGDGADTVEGDPRASWLAGDTAEGGRHNWEKKEPVEAPGDIRDPRAPE